MAAYSIEVDRLLCNLIRSYVDYLLAEHRRHVDPESAGF